MTPEGLPNSKLSLPCFGKLLPVRAFMLDKARSSGISLWLNVRSVRGLRAILQR